MINIGKFLRVLIYSMSVLLAFGFAGGCAKKLLPPEIDGSAGANLSADSSGGSGSSGNFKDFDGPSRLDGSGDGVILSDEDMNAGDSSFPTAGSLDGSGMGSGNGGDSSFMGDGSTGAFDGSGESTAALKVFRETNDLKDIHFAFDEYSLNDNMKAILRKNAEWLKKNPHIKVEIQGHCDERGTNNYNLGLGERRTLIAKKYLVALGLEEDRLFTISYGEEKPFCFESTKDCWQSNRRDHFMISE